MFAPSGQVHRQPEWAGEPRTNQSMQGQTTEWLAASGECLLDRFRSLLVEANAKYAKAEPNARTPTAVAIAILQYQCRYQYSRTGNHGEQAPASTKSGSLEDIGLIIGLICNKKYLKNIVHKLVHILSK